MREEQEHGIVVATARSVGAKHGEGSFQGGTYLFRREDLAGGRRPPDLGETRPGWEFVREEQEHGIVAAAARSRRGGEK